MSRDDCLLVRQLNREGSALGTVDMTQTVVGSDRHHVLDCTDLVFYPPTNEC